MLQNPTYFGDPFNVVRNFNDEEIDELIFLDIEATEKREGRHQHHGNRTAGIFEKSKRPVRESKYLSVH